MLARNRYGAVVVAAGTLDVETAAGALTGTVKGTVVEVGTVVVGTVV